MVCPRPVGSLPRTSPFCRWPCVVQAGAMHIKRDAISGLDHSTSPPTYIACHLTTSNIHTKSSSMLSAIFLISMIAIQCQASPLTLMRRAYGEGGCQEDPSSDRIIDAWLVTCQHLSVVCVDTQNGSIPSGPQSRVSSTQRRPPSLVSTKIGSVCVKYP